MARSGTVEVESGKPEGELIAQIEGKLDGLGKRIRIFKRAKSFVVSFALSHPLCPARCVLRVSRSTGWEQISHSYSSGAPASG